IPYVATGVVVMCALWSMRGQLVGSQQSNRIRFNPAQMYLYAICLAVLWGPLWIEELARMWRPTLARALMRSWGGGGIIGRSWGAAAIIGGIAALCLLFDNPHPWNADPDYLRNRLLVGMQTSPVVCAAMCTVIVMAGIAAVHFARRQSNARELAVVAGTTL